MAYKDILAPVVTLEHDRAALEAAAAIAETFEAHVTALIVAVHLASEFSASHTLSEVLADIGAGARSAAALERKKITAWLEQAPTPFEIRDATIEDAVAYGEVLAHARLADLIVCRRNNARHLAHRALFERILFGSGRPVLLLPAAAQSPFMCKRVLIGWNATTEATRAIVAALPFLQRAEAVTIATLDALPSRSGHGQAPGCELATYLAHHDVKSTVRNMDSLGRTHARVLLDEAKDRDADLIVLGAYGRSRAAEFLLGGVTRELLDQAPLPLLLMH